ncbi:MAG: hypothetical protein Q8O59_00675 [bacterium]|nr:hypothetical protein [bacterium]
MAKVKGNGEGTCYLSGVLAFPGTEEIVSDNELPEESEGNFDPEELLIARLDGQALTSSLGGGRWTDKNQATRAVMIACNCTGLQGRSTL